MREIKFRVWDKKEKCFLDCNSDCMYNLYVTDDGGSDVFKIDYDGEHHMLQYTGLKDINGVEIFEGDILNISKTFDGDYVPVYVLFENGEFKVQVIHKMLPTFSLITNRCLYEVIDNIYENKEKWVF